MASSPEQAGERAVATSSKNFWRSGCWKPPLGPLDSSGPSSSLCTLQPRSRYQRGMCHKTPTTNMIRNVPQTSYRRQFWLPSAGSCRAHRRLHTLHQVRNRNRANKEKELLLALTNECRTREGLRRFSRGKAPIHRASLYEPMLKHHARISVQGCPKGRSKIIIDVRGPSWNLVQLRFSRCSLSFVLPIANNMVTQLLLVSTSSHL